MAQLKNFILVFALLFSGIVAQSQVIVNEFSASNYDDWNVGGDFNDWVELYNPTGAAVDISGYWLSEDITDPMKWEIPAGTVVGANDHLVILCSDEWVNNEQTGGYWNTTFKITQTRDEAIVFSDPSGTVLESYEFSSMGTTQMNHSWGRQNDGDANWTIHSNPSPDGANSGSSITGYADTPVFSIEAGYYASDQLVTISVDDGSTIYYTTDGSAPDDTSTPYAGGILVAATQTLRAIAVSDDANTLPSFIETNTYFRGDDQHTMQIFNIAGATLSDGSWWGDELTVIEHFDENGNFVTEGHGDSNEHGNDSNAYDQRGFDYITRDQMGYDWALEEVLFEESSARDNYQRLIFKAAANDNYSFQNGGAHMRDLYIHVLSERADLKLDERTGEYCIVYINGEYWGVYDVREKADDLDYTDFRYDQRRGFVDYLKTWGGTWQEFGDGQGEWDDLVDFILGNDMSDPANYDYVKSLLNTNSLIDYFIIGSYTVTADWLNWNTAWWKGNHPDGDHKKWGYVLWDLDASFGHYINYTGIPDTGPEADPCNPEVLGDPGGQGHVPILNALFDNEEFTSDYINRYADLVNTYLSCDYMLGMVDEFEAILEPEMERQTSTWGGTVAGWQANVQEMYDFIEDRCSTVIVEGMEDCYEVEAVDITLSIFGEGEVELSTVTLNENDTPWTGIYYTETIMELVANIDLGSFLYWEIVSGDVVLADPTDPFLEFEITGDVEIIAYFAPPEPQEVTFVVLPEGEVPGDITLDGTLLGVYPYTEVIEYGSHDIIATENEWWAFVGWETSFGSTIGDETLLETTLFVNQPDTLFAVFEYIDHWTIDVDGTVTNDPEVDDATISVEGEVIDPDTWSEVIIGGEDVNIEFDSNDPWVVFEYWEVIGDIIIVGDPTDPDGTFTINGDGTIIPVYSITPHFNIWVAVEPTGAGSVSMEGTTLTLPHNQVMQGEIDIAFSTTPADEWSYFSHWEVNNAVITPDEFSTDIFANFTTDDELVAVYTVLPHYPITVEVRPLDKGTVIVDNDFEVRTSWTGEMRGDDPVPFQIIPDEFFTFNKWTANDHNPTPDNLSKEVFYVFEQSDTITAYLDEEFFLFFMPNSFTPNNDGINDIFKPEGYAYEVDNYSLQIFNRWGVKVFETTDFDEGWNGSHDLGEYYSPDEIYTYIVSIKSVHDIEPKEFSGSVYVFR